jgi:uncharacterized membrane protein
VVIGTLGPLFPVAAVAASVVTAIAWYGSQLLARDSGLATPAYDQAFFQQLVWNLDHGRWFQSSFNPGSFLGVHFEPLLLVAAVVELVWSDPRALSVLAAVSIAALAPAAFLFLRALLGKDGVAAALAAPLPLWPALQEAGLAGFHPETMGLDLALLAGWAGLRGRTALSWTFAFLSLCAKEDQAWNVLVVGLVLVSVPLRRSLGLKLGTVAVIWGIGVTTVLMPALRAGQHVDTDSYYRWLSGASPAAIFHALTRPTGWWVLLVMLLCAGGLPLLRPLWLGLAALPFAADLLSRHEPQPLLRLQYAVPLVIPIVVAAAMAARRFTLPAWLTPALGLAPLLLALNLGGLPPAAGATVAPFKQAFALDRLAACTSRLPALAPTAADDTLLPPLASRPSVRDATLARSTDYVVLDRKASPPTADGNLPAAAKRRVLCDDGRFVLLGPATS